MPHVIALFRLKPDRTIGAYREWSLSHVRPIMRRMDSVISFRDFQVTGSMDDETSPHELCEIIEITDVAQFELDNSTVEGETLAGEWQSWLREWTVLYLQDLEAPEDT